MQGLLSGNEEHAHETPILPAHRRYRRRGRRHAAGRRPCHRRQAHPLEDGHHLAQELPRAGHGRQSPGQAHRGDERRPHTGQGLWRQGAGAGVRGVRCGGARHGAAGARCRLLLEGQVRDRPVLLHRALRHDGPRDERLAVPWRRHGALARTLRAVRADPGRGRQLGRADGRLVQQGDPFRRRSQGPEDAHPRTGRRGAAAGRRHACEPPRRRALHLPAVGGDRCHRMGQSLQRPRLRPLQGRQILLLSRLARARHHPRVPHQPQGLRGVAEGSAGDRARRLPHRQRGHPRRIHGPQQCRPAHPGREAQGRRAPPARRRPRPVAGNLR